MSESRTRLRIAAGLILGLLASSALAPAYATPSGLTGQLCGADTISCSVRPSGTVREGVQVSVALTGRPTTTVPLRLYRIDLTGDRITGLTPIGSATPAETNAHGTGWARLPVPAGDGTAGWALLSVADLTATRATPLDPAETVGSFSQLQGRRPMLLGDGYAEQKPVGRDLDLQLAGAVTGHRFAVEYQDDAGLWREVTTPTRAARDERTGISRIGYQVPRGLRAKAYTFRLRNLSDPAETQQWQVIPATEGVPQQRDAPWSPPATGQRVIGAKPVISHDSRLVRFASLGITAAALALLTGCAAIRARRLPRPRTVTR